MTENKSSLIETVRECNHSLLEDFMESGASANERDEATGETILAIAAQLGDTRLLNILLRAGADPNAASSEWPLDAAAGCGHLEVVEQLLDAEADVGAINEDGGTALEAAACIGHQRIVSLLLEAGANPKRKDHNGKPAIIYAAERGHEEIVAELMPLSTPKFRQQANLILKLESQGTPSTQVLEFFTAVEDGDLDEIRRYLEDEGDTEAMDSEGRTALCKAAQSNQAEVVKLLVEHGANPKHLDKNGICPVEFATNCPTAFNYLYSITPKKFIKKSIKVLAPLIAIKDERNATLERKLAEQGLPDKAIFAYLIGAKGGNLNVVKAYLEKGGCVDAMDETGETALMWASRNGKLDVVKHLVEAGANVNHMNRGQNYALLDCGLRNKCYVYFFLQPLTEKVLREYADALVKSRNVWWI